MERQDYGVPSHRNTPAQATVDVQPAACALLGLGAKTLATDSTKLGRMFETFVVRELIKEASWWDDANVDFYHFRERDGQKRKVDIVMDAGHRGIVGVEAKVSASLTTDDFNGLRELKRLTGDRFATGVIIYDGEACAPFDEDLWAVPAGMLWG